MKKEQKSKFSNMQTNGSQHISPEEEKAQDI